MLTLFLPLSFPTALPATPGSSATTDGVFNQFTHHIQEHIASDKIAFARASGCTSWFYRQEKHKPAPLDVHPISLDLLLQPPSREDCLRLYPGGLDAVRRDLHRTQSSLSVSLTSYEFALVGDRNDDAHYNREELHDLFQSLALAYDPVHSPATQATTLTERFDVWYRTRDLEHMMNGMSRLYEKGYRVTPADRAELDRIIK
ncbi:MAG: hypothetical protein HY038_03460 [Nitrospirae bacterium]|nr:hypothetical protein [Nitrospirota bacterium]